MPRLTPAPLPTSGQRPNAFYGLITELGTLGFAIWMGYVAVVNPIGPTPVFYDLFYAAIILWVVGGTLNRRMTQVTPARKETS
jgi:hypothetical protein